MTVKTVDVISGFCTVEMDDGQVYIGTVSSGPDDTIVIRTGYRGKPVHLDAYSVVEVLPVNSENPHIER